MINLDHNRYCIVGQPRCGSHHLESVIYNQMIARDSSTVKMGEFLHWWSGRFSRFNVVNGQLNNIQVTSEVDSLSEFRRRVDMLTHLESSQSLVARLFFIDNMMINFKDLAKLYQSAGFKFIYINRSYEEQLISWYFSYEENKWTQSLFEKEKTIDIDKLKLYMFDFVKNKIVGERWLETIDHQTIDYSYLKNYNSDHFKMMPNDPYELIVNADEVKEVFAKHYSLLETRLLNLI